MDAQKVLMDITKSIEKNTNVKAVFGEPQKIGKKIIIPVASVKGFAGAGGGEGSKGTESEKKQTGSGGGGCMHVESRPVGYIEITGNKVQFVPIIDISKVILRGIFNGLIAILLFGSAALAMALNYNLNKKR